MAESDDISLRPGPGTWERMLRERRDLGAEARLFREELGLATDRPVVMAGHQAGIWHPGILAKLLALTALARRTGAEPAWLVVDQDTNDLFSIRYPMRDAARAGVLAARVWKSGSTPTVGGRIAGHVPTGRVAAGTPTPLPGDAEMAATRCVREGLRAMHDALTSGAKEASAARQFAKAAAKLAAPLAGEVRLVFVSDVVKTTLFAKLLRKMAEEGAQASATYQRAIGAEPEGFRAAHEDGDLPLWKLDERTGSARKGVHVGQIDPARPTSYAPRALLLTGMMRLAGCDLFIHGTGGAGTDGQGGYDTITERWFKEWLGATLAPMTMATASVRLRIAPPPTGAAVTPEDIARTRWLAHAARHRPALLYDAEGASAREPVVATLVKLKNRRDSESRRVKREAFKSLHATLDMVRARHVADLARLDAEAAAAAARRAEAEIVADRTWAFPLYEPEQLTELRNRIDGAFGR